VEELPEPLKEKVISLKSERCIKFITRLGPISFIISFSSAARINFLS
jgi:hypothetical protein